MPNNFSTQIKEVGGVVAPAVLRQTQGAGSTALSTVSGGLNSFIQSNNAERKRKAAAKKAEREETDLQAAIYTEESVLKASTDFRQREQNLFDVFRPTSPTQGVEPSSVPDEEVNGPSSSVANWDPDTFLQAAVETGAVTSHEVNEVENFVGERADDAENARAAQQQGTMSQLSASATIEEIIQDVRAQYPNVHPDVITGVLAKLGVDKIPFMELKKAAEEAESSRQTGIDYKNDMYELGLSLVGPVAASQMTREQIILQGAADTQVEMALARQAKNLDLTKTNLDITAAQRDQQEALNVKEIEEVVTQGIYSGLSPLIENFNKLLISAGETGANPAIEAELEKTRLLMRQHSGVLIERYISQMSIKDIDEADKVRDFFNKTIERTVFAPLEARDEGLGQLAKKMQDRLGINATLTYPFISMLKELGVGVSITDAMLGAMDSNTAKALGNEIAGLSKQDVNSLLRGNPASLHLTGIIEVLQGDKSIEELRQSPAEARKTFQSVQAVDRTVRDEIADGNFANAEAFTNTRAEIVIAASKLNKASGGTALTNALVSLMGAYKSTSKGLRNLREINDVGGIVASEGTRAGIGHVLSALQSSPDLNDGPYVIRWNNDRGEYYIQDNWKEPKSPSGRGETYWGLGATKYGKSVKPPLPTQLARRMKTMNSAINYLIATRDWDDGAPEGSNLELRRYYGTGKATPAMIKAAEEQTSVDRAAKAPDTAALRSLQEFNKSLESGDFSIPVPNRAGANGASIGADGSATVKGQNGNSVTVKSVAALSKTFANNPVFKAVANIATASGIPPEIALVLAGHEGRFNPKAKADAGKGRTAWGPMQVVDTFHDGTAKKMFGKRVKDLTMEENVQLGLSILKDNFSAAGNWKDALAMYHSGKPYDKATKSDGNIYTQQYVDGLMGAMGIR